MSTGNRNFRDSFSARSGLSAVDVERLNSWSVDIGEELHGPACKDASGYRRRILKLMQEAVSRFAPPKVGGRSIA